MWARLALSGWKNSMPRGITQSGLGLRNTASIASSSFVVPRNAVGAMRPPVLTPETPSKTGRASGPGGAFDQPRRNPEANAPMSPPPDRIRKSTV